MEMATLDDLEKADLLVTERCSLTGEGAPPQLSPRRFVALAGFSLLSLSNAAMFIGFASIVDQTRAVFGASVVEVNLLTSIFYIMYIAATPCTAVLLGSLGVRVTLLVGASLNLLGALVKVLAAWLYPEYGLLFLGQLLCALPVVCILPIPPVLAARWFSEGERTLATTVCATFDNIGIAIGLLLAPSIVNNIGSSQQTGMAILFLVHFIMASIPLTILLSVPEQPPHPPSQAEAHRREQEAVEADKPKESVGIIAAIKEECITLVVEGKQTIRASNGSAGLVVVAAGCSVGTSWSFAGLLLQLLMAFGVSSNTVGLIGFVSIGTGCLASFLVGGWVGKARVYRGPLVALVFTASLCFAATLVTLKEGSTAIVNPGPNDALYDLPHSTLAAVFALLVVAGTALNCVPPIAFELVAETVFPLNPDIGATLLMFIGTCVAMITTLAVPPILLPSSASETSAASRSLGGMGMLSGIVFISTVLLTVSKPVLARLAHERQ